MIRTGAPIQRLAPEVFPDFKKNYALQVPLR